MGCIYIIISKNKTRNGNSGSRRDLGIRKSKKTLFLYTGKIPKMNKFRNDRISTV